jgi:hypothetical protein
MAPARARSRNERTEEDDAGPHRMLRSAVHHTAIHRQRTWSPPPFQLVGPPYRTGPLAD